MHIAQELVLVGTSVEGRNLLGTSRNLVLAGAFLTELAVLERLAVDGKKLRVHDPGPTGDYLLDDALVRFAKLEGKKPKDVLDKVGKHLLEPVLESLATQELIRPEPVSVIGLTLWTRWPVVVDGPRQAVLIDLAQVLTGARDADSRTGALISLLHAVGALHTVVPEDLRPGMTNRDVKRRGKEVLKGRWAPEAVAKAVEEAAAAAMVAVTAAAGAGSS
ncbi:GOLPH3/VPS74 family protein [Ornithinimicrobium pratense]|uniref:GPP34 family phosphoprotein n=1 Tax=Ornithinimicrobium pratense TaxID=2593973 RepID=A0A5J6V6W0_9MICO|nr:GPP34 family phosphoprotein [Ornithinimicrobium pratense]QFG69528.1 GPP34 family phosphoprotein [Ornithinimicrobium pratense]